MENKTPELLDLQSRLNSSHCPDLIAFVVMNGLGYLKEEDMEKFMKRREELVNKDPKNFKDEVVFIINGVQIPFEKALKDAEKQFDNLIHEKARDLLKDRIQNIQVKLIRIEEDVDEILGPKPSRSD